VKTFFDVQRAQRQRTAVLIALDVLLLIAVGYLLAAPVLIWQACSVESTSSCQPLGVSWPTVAVVTVLVALYLWVAVATAARRSLPSVARPLSSSPHEQRLVPIAEQMAMASGSAVPRLLVLDDAALNAFAAWDRGTPVVVVTSGMLQRLDNRQLTGVVAHEFAHLKNRDARVIWFATFGVGLVLVVAAAFTMAGFAAARSTERDSEDDQRQNGGAAGLGLVLLIMAAVLWMIAVPVAFVVRATISRRREQLADASAVQFTRDPGGLRQALEILAAGQQVPATVRMSNAALWISDPGAVSRLPRWVGRLLDTHPPIEQRIAWLRTLEGANALWADLP
jgi:heat shock protein HtpX